MSDVHSEVVRSRNMAAIRATNTKPELMLRRAVFARGLRYRIHHSRLPGRPDLVFSQFRAVVFVHGCFFHGHECATFRWPETRREFWHTKIQGNRARDYATSAKLRAAGWRVLTVWECALRGRTRLPLDEVAESVDLWLHTQKKGDSIAGR
jgi:DNA mismatch endonuclease (patch repair protein)